MIEVDLVRTDPLLAEQRKPCICCGSDIGGVLVIRESGDLKIARLELEVAIKSIHGLQPLIDRVAKLKADDDARHGRMIKAERERLAQVIGNAPEFRSAPLGNLRIS